MLLWLGGLITAPWWAVGDTLLDLRAAWWLVPATVLAVAWFQLVSAVLVRAEHYRDLAGRNAVQGVGTAATQLGFGIAGAGGLGLLLGVGLGRLAGLVAVSRRGLPGLGPAWPRPRPAAPTSPCGTGWTPSPASAASPSSPPGPRWSTTPASTRPTWSSR